MRARPRKQQSGQTATEYLLVVSVAVLALVGAAYTFVPSFRSGVSTLAHDVQSTLGAHELTLGSQPGFGSFQAQSRSASGPADATGDSSTTSSPAVVVPGSEVVACGAFGCVRPIQ